MFSLEYNLPEPFLFSIEALRIMQTLFLYVFFLSWVNSRFYPISSTECRQPLHEKRYQNGQKLKFQKPDRNKIEFQLVSKKGFENSWNARTR